MHARASLPNRNAPHAFKATLGPDGAAELLVEPLSGARHTDSDGDDGDYKLEEAHGSQQPTEPDDDAVRIWKFVLLKREMDEESGWIRQRLAELKAKSDE